MQTLLRSHDACSGEPSLMLVASVLAAIRQAVAAAHMDPATLSDTFRSSTLPPATMPAAKQPPATSKTGHHPGSSESNSSGAEHERTSSHACETSQPSGYSTSQTTGRREDQASAEMDDVPGAPTGSFPGSFLGLEAPATVARVRDAIGGPSIATMLRKAAGLGITRMSSDDWELL